jgi:hypothetical protein
MRKAVSKNLIRRLEELEAAASVERFHHIGGIVCVGMRAAEAIEPSAHVPAVEMEDDKDLIAKEIGNPETIVVQEIVAEEMKDREPAAKKRGVYDWYVELDGLISNITMRICSDLSDLGRNYRRNADGKMSEDLGLERGITESLGGFVIWVVAKPGSKPFPTKVGTRWLKYLKS